MTTDLDTPLPDTAFWRAYQGRFKGILTWPQFDALWERLETDDGAWFVYELGGHTPADPLSGDAFRALLNEAREMYTHFRKQSYCGAVYVDDAGGPTFLKVFDPMNMGAVCGTSGERTLPRWTFSRMRPDPLPAEEVTPRKSGLFARLRGAVG